MITLLNSLIIAGFLTVPPVPGDYCTTNNPDFKEFRYEQQVAICNRNVSYEKKNEICERDGVYDRSNFTVDHIIPLSLGGNNSDDNLWCQHKSINTASLELEMYKDVKKRIRSVDEAIRVILNTKFRTTVD